MSERISVLLATAVVIALAAAFVAAAYFLVMAADQRWLQIAVVCMASAIFPPLAALVWACSFALCRDIGQVKKWEAAETKRKAEWLRALDNLSP